MKKHILVLFGGRSTEHEVSCRSAFTVASHIDPEEWEVLAVGITKSGAWLLAPDLNSLTDGRWYDSKIRAFLSPDAEEKKLLIRGEGREEDVSIDCIFPVLHGRFGEDGTVQGLFELSGIPYVGCGVLASAVGMDKFFTKIIAETVTKELGVRQARFVGVRAADLKAPERIAEKVEAAFPYPVFIKPSNAGSSCGVTKAHTREELLEGLEKAAAVDTKSLVEEFIGGRALECAVFSDGSGEILSSGVGEILSAAEFYDYDAKYNNPDSETKVDPDIPAEVRETIRRAAAGIFRAVDGYGLSRVDFFWSRTGEVIFNEINTMPGFTAISMYPMLFEARGIDRKALVRKLIESAFTRPEVPLA